MVLAQMTVEVPKNGASRRVAAISAPSDETPTANTSASSGSTPLRDLTAVTPRRLALEGRKVRLPGAADGAIPVGRNVLEGGARVDAAVGVALLRVIDEAAGLADPLPVGFGTHGRAS